MVTDALPHFTTIGNRNRLLMMVKNRKIPSLHVQILQKSDRQSVYKHKSP
jgi:hypothetical protein